MCSTLGGGGILLTSSRQLNKLNITLWMEKRLELRSDKCKPAVKLQFHVEWALKDTLNGKSMEYPAE